MFGLMLLLILNFIISVVNAYGAGTSWRQTRSSGGFPHLLNWCAAIMSACGFTWCYSILLAGGAYGLGFMTAVQIVLALKLGYVVIIPAVIGTGLVITINSWVEFYRRRDFASGAEAAWNTYAQISNTVNAVTFFPEALGDLSAFFGGKSKSDSSDSSSRAAILVIGLVVLSLLAGTLTTRYILLSAASSVQT